jgi:hypothetical protein
MHFSLISAIRKATIVLTPSIHPSYDHSPALQVISPRIPSEIVTEDRTYCDFSFVKAPFLPFTDGKHKGKQSTGEDQHRTLGTKSGLIYNSTRTMQLCATRQSGAAFPMAQ